MKYIYVSTALKYILQVSLLRTFFLPHYFRKINIVLCFTTFLRLFLSPVTLKHSFKVSEWIFFPLLKCYRKYAAIITGENQSQLTTYSYTEVLIAFFLMLATADENDDPLPEHPWTYLKSRFNISEMKKDSYHFKCYIYCVSTYKKGIDIKKKTFKTIQSTFERLSIFQSRYSSTLTQNLTE